MLFKKHYFEQHFSTFLTMTWIFCQWAISLIIELLTPQAGFLLIYNIRERVSGGMVYSFSCLRFQTERFKLEEKSLTNYPYMKLFIATGNILASGWLNGHPDLRQNHSEFWKFPSENFTAIGWSPLSFPLYTSHSFRGKSVKNVIIIKLQTFERSC